MGAVKLLSSVLCLPSPFEDVVYKQQSLTFVAFLVCARRIRKCF